MALARIKGLGIWFGKPCETLYIGEGPEDCLTLRELGAKFIVCTIYGTNYHNITIPFYVKNVILIPQWDQAGRSALERAKTKYTHINRTLKIYNFPEIKLSNNKYADINDIFNPKSLLNA